MKSKLGKLVVMGAVTVGCCAAFACGDDSRPGDNGGASALPSGGMTATAGHAGTSPGPGGTTASGTGGTGGTAGMGGAAGTASGGLGGAERGGSSNDGGTFEQPESGGAAAGGDTGEAVGGETHDTGDGGDGSGGDGGGGKLGVDTDPYPAITLAGLTTAVELAPVRLAANGIYPAKVNVISGGVDALFGSNPPLVATNAETQALRASVKNKNLRIIFTVCEGLYRIVAKKSAGILTLADLKGKTIDYSPGTSSAYFLHQMLGLVNLTESDVKTGSAPSGSSSGQAAGYWEPNMEQYAASISAADRIEFQKDDAGHEVYRELFNLHATAESLADPIKRRTIVGFVRSLIIASEQIRADPNAVYPLLTGPTGVSQKVLEGSFKYERYAGTLVSDLLDQLTVEEVWHAKANGREARTRAQLAPLVDDSILRDAYSP